MKLDPTPAPPPRRLTGSAATAGERILGAAAGAVFLLALACATLAWLGLAGWLVGETISDRYYFTQFLEWMPTPAALAGSGALLVLGWVLARFRHVLADPSTRSARVQRAIRWGWLPWGAILVYFFTIEAPLFRSRPGPPPTGVDHFRLVFWNASAWYQDGWESGIGGAEPDIVILSGLGSTKRLPELQSMMKDVVSVIIAERFIVLSKRPITRHGFTSLGVARGQGLDPRFGGWTSPRADHGHALFFEVQHPATANTPAGSSIVHVIDLPSDLSLLRWEVTARARRALDHFAGITYVPDPLGRWIPENPPAPTTGFPSPDIVIGDFNIPRGAASLSALSRGLTNAFDQAGRGFMASYPRRPPVFHIDQTFLAPGLRAFNYRLLDIGAGAHLVQSVDIARK